ncbi:MAG: AAA family ATPase [Candidatus Paceibacterota bacterium]
MTQEQAFKIMKTGVNIYLTGSAGSGKTYLLNQYIRYLDDHNIAVAVTASTGIAATHMNGMTIHGWSGIGVKSFMGEKELELLEEKKYLWKRFEKARVLIIDEVSMLHGFQLDMIEKVCKRFKRSSKPFGGLQVILSGDFFQLPPVVASSATRREGGRESIPTSPTCGPLMVYESEAWKILNPAICYLSEQHRQEDDILTEILNNIRTNKLKEKHYEHLDKCIDRELKGIKPTKLYTHNMNVDDENNLELEQIGGEERVYHMTSKGHDVIVDILKKSCLAYEELRLKIGAEVMCIKNNFEKGYVNGTRGVVVDFEDDTGLPIIKLYNGNRVVMNTEVWAIEEDGKVKASLTQLPLRLAWAITIHKSQGMSLDNALIDLRSTFTYGMGYVALSRVRTLSGICLIGFTKESLLVDPKVLMHDQDLQNESYQNELMFNKLKNGEQKMLEVEFINRMEGTIHIGNRTKVALSATRRGGGITKTPTILVTKEYLDEGKNIKEIAKERNLTAGTITHHIEQIMKDYPETIITHIRPTQKNIDLVKKANKKLKGEEIGKLNPIKLILEKEGSNLSFEDIRLAKLFI